MAHPPPANGGRAGLLCTRPWRSPGGPVAAGRAQAIKRRASKAYRAHARAEIRNGQHGYCIMASQYGDTAEAARKRHGQHGGRYRKLLTEAVRLAGEHSALHADRVGDRRVRRRELRTWNAGPQLLGDDPVPGPGPGTAMSAQADMVIAANCARVLTLPEAKAGEGSYPWLSRSGRPAVRWPAARSSSAVPGGGWLAGFCRSRPQGTGLSR